MGPAHKDRAIARSEILFESTRNAEVRAAAQSEIGRIEALLVMQFRQLGAARPRQSRKSSRC